MSIPQISPIQILMIDDDRAYYESLINFAASPPRLIQLLYASNLEDGVELLKSNDRIAGVILDGKGLLSDKTVGAFPTDAFVHEAIEKIRELERVRNRKWPFIVLTAYLDSLVGAIEPRGIRVFDKKSIAADEVVKARMFSQILTMVNDQFESQVDQRYQNYLNMFGKGNLPMEQGKLLKSVLLASAKGHIYDGAFNSLRILVEAITVSLLERIGELPESIVDGWMKSGKLLRYSKFYLWGKDVKEGVRLIWPAREETRITNERLRPFAEIISFSENMHAYSHFSRENWQQGVKMSLFNTMVNAILFELDLMKDLFSSEIN